VKRLLTLCLVGAGLLAASCTEAEKTVHTTGIAPPRSLATAAEAPTPHQPQEGHLRLPSEQAQLLRDWFRRLGLVGAKESFGQLITRAGRLQVDRPYLHKLQRTEVERLTVELASFQCVSFVESTLAVARCTWIGAQTEACFMEEMQRSRYRHGKMAGYPSRLHYFSDWLADNATRRRISLRTHELGGETATYPFNYMSRHASRYPSLAIEENLRAIAADESRLSTQEFSVLSRERLQLLRRGFADGDLVAFVGNKQGILVTHAGFVDLAADKTPRVLHASSYHKRVLLTKSGVAAYVLRKPERRGIMVARPLPPTVGSDGE